MLFLVKRTTTTRGLLPLLPLVAIWGDHRVAEWRSVRGQLLNLVIVPGKYTKKELMTRNGEEKGDPAN